MLALQDFQGAVVTVSHDRALLRGACDRFLLVANGTVAAFDGDLEDYAAWLARGTALAPLGELSAPATGSRREQRRLGARLGELSRDISSLEERWLEVASSLEVAG